MEKVFVTQDIGLEIKAEDFGDHTLFLGVAVANLYLTAAINRDSRRNQRRKYFMGVTKTDWRF